ncbi:MAG TPA: diacylglycerol kinase family protein [Pyrinomonadaceae bacterium]|nr:diacylglycerol kinase family protein [Pyrinomonadaceae bacterium]
MSLSPLKIIISANARLVAANGNLREILTRTFDDHHVDIDLSIARNGDELTELAREAVRGPFKTIVAGGGDGTVSSVAGEVINSDKALGVLPLGTLNHFAKDLRIPLDLAAAAATIVAGHTTEVDVAEVNNRIFLNNSSLGLYPIIVREREKRERLGFKKWPAFVWAIIQAFRRYPFLDVRVHLNDEYIDRTTPFVFVGNNEYVMSLLNIGWRDRLDKGMLSIYITHRTSRLKLIGLAMRAVIGRLSQDKDFLALSSDEVKIETRHKRLRVAFDGEIDVMQPPLHYRIRSRALRVVVPETAVAE